MLQRKGVGKATGAESAVYLYVLNSTLLWRHRVPVVVSRRGCWGTTRPLARGDRVHTVLLPTMGSSNILYCIV